MRVLVFLLVMTAAGAADSAVLGVILDVQGSASLVEGGKTTRLDILTPLPAGSQVTLEDKARVTLVLYKNNGTYELAGPSLIGIEDDSLKALRGPAPQLKNVSQGHAAVAVEGINRRLALSAVALRGGANAKPTLALALPSQDVALISSEPELSWQAGSDSISREVVIQEITGQEVARLSAREDRLRVPGSAGLKPGGEYIWSVTVRFPGGRNETRERVFRILASADVELINSLKPTDEGDVAAWVLYAAALDKFGASDEARRVWKIVSEKNPSSERAKLIGN